MKIKTLVSVCDTHWEVFGRFHPGQVNWTRDGAKLTDICSIVGCVNETVQGIWMESVLVEVEFSYGDEGTFKGNQEIQVVNPDAPEEKQQYLGNINVMPN